MAERANKQEASAPPMSEALEASLKAAKVRVSTRKRARGASDAVNDETARRPFSTRLTAREVHRLRLMALTEGEGATELARRLILDGLLRLEAKHLADPKRTQLAEVVDHLNAQVDATKAIISILVGGGFATNAPAAHESKPKRTRARADKLAKA